MKEKIREFIAQTSFVDKSKIEDATQLFTEGVFDSMGLLGLISFIEAEYGVKTSDLELNEDNFNSLNSICSFIERKKN